MKKTKKIYPGGFYFIESRCTANSCYFTNKKECKLFHNYLDRWLGGLVTIYDFLLMEDGWILALKIKDTKELDKFIKRQYGENKFDEYWKFISEQVRQMLSTYVKRVNQYRGRSGTLVHSSYTRHYFERLSEAKFILSQIRNSEISNRQGRKKYRAKKKRYYRLIKMGKGHVLLSSKDRKEREVNVDGRIKSFVYRDFKDVVLLNMVDNTISVHKSPPPPP